MNIKKILITGMFRSGTTLVTKALNVHPNVSAIPDPFFELFKHVRSVYYSKRISNYDKGQPFSDKFLEDNDFNQKWLKEFSSVKLTVKDVAAIVKKLKISAELHTPQMLPLIKTVKRGGSVKEVLERFVRLVPKAYPAQGEQKAIAFKDVWIEELTEPFLKMGYGVVYCVRDLRAIVASKRKLQNGDYPLLFLIHQWRKSVAYAILSAERRRFFLTRFEDMILNPEKIFRAMARRLGISYSSQMKDPTQYKDGKGKRWQGNSSFKKLNTINKKVADQWKSVLNEKEVRLIEFLCASEMRHFGYKPAHKNLSMVDLVKYQDKKSDFTEWIRKYNYHLTDERRQEEIARMFVLGNPEMKWGTEVIRDMFIGKEVYSALSKRL